MVTVLMPTLNGARYLEAQIYSLAAQRMPPSLLLVSDDGSSDGTAALVRTLARHMPFPTRLLRGPGRGLAANALALLAAAPPGPAAFADQDDVWLPDKLGRAVAALNGASAGAPRMYAARRIVTDAQLRRRQRSGGPCPAPRPGFANALVQNIAPANTIVLNAAALRLARSAAPEVRGPLPYHDWWLYQLITGCGGDLRLDDAEVVLYRQHNANFLGAPGGARGRLRRMHMLLSGRFGGDVRGQMRALTGSAHRLTPEARMLLWRTADLLQEPRPRLSRLGLYRQSAAEQMLLCATARMGRL